MKKIFLSVMYFAIIMVLCSCSKNSKGNLEVNDNEEIELSNITENGMYYVQGGLSIICPGSFKGEDQYKISFIDFTTKKEIILCSNPSCTHDDGSCPAVLENGKSGNIVCGKDNLFLFESYIDKDAPKVIKMDFDGLNRETIYEFESGVNIDRILMQKGQYIYMLTYRMSDMDKDSSDGYEKSVSRLNIDTKEMEDIMVLDKQYDVIGYYNNKLIVDEIISDKDLDIYDNMLNAKYRLSSIDINTEKIQMIKEFPKYDGIVCIIENNYIYYSDKNENIMAQIDLLSLEDKVICEESYNITNAFDNLIICVDWDQEEIRLDNGFCTYKYDGFIINVDDGLKVKLPYMKDEEFPIEVLYDTEKNFLVKYVMKDKYTYLPDLDTYTSEPGELKYGIISKEDLLNGKDNYEEIDMMGLSYL